MEIDVKILVELNSKEVRLVLDGLSYRLQSAKVNNQTEDIKICEEIKEKFYKVML